MASDILTSFHPLITSWFAKRFGNPTDVQERAWREIAAGNHVLVTAPTGSGKTLAAFLWGIDRLVTGAWPSGGTRILYVSPLKALNNDVRRNLIGPLEELSLWFRSHGSALPPIDVRTRSGDTPGSDRQRMLRHPPEILITTPESLNILLTSQGGRHSLAGVATVIIDEIHAVIGSKRGTHLITAVDRLVPLVGEFQRIALSATVNPLETVAEVVGGFRREGETFRKRPVSIVTGRQPKEYRLQVRGAEALSGEPGLELWPRLAREFVKIVAAHGSTLFFVNSRRTAERVTRAMNEEAGAELAYAHHGSLSREIRLAVEDKLKRGELKAIVATNSLELGIDIGRLDMVVLVQTPRTISSAIQRIGRSGHGVGEVSRGLLFPTHGMDFIDAAVASRAIAEGEVEPLRPVEGPLDLLAQIVLSMVLVEEWDLDELYLFLRASWPYRNLSRKHFDLVVGMLEGRYADAHIPELRPRVSVDRLADRIVGREGLATVIYLEGGTIPDRGYFDLRLGEGGAKIGELDEEFVWERKLGETFSLGAQVWQITRITHNSVEVAPARRPQQVIPFWRGEELDRDFFYAEKIGTFLEWCDGRIGNESFSGEVASTCALDDGAAASLTAFLRRQKEATGAPLPHRHHLLIEHFYDPQGGAETQQVILHTLWGNGVNRPLTFALAAAWEREQGVPLEAFYTNDGIALLLPQDVDPQRLLSLVSPDNIETLLRLSLEKTGFFGARFRENAGRALLLSKSAFRKRMPLWLTRLRAKKLLGAVSRYRDFPVVLETWRSCLQDDFDLPTLRRLLAEIADGEIRITETRTTTASPFAEGLIWQQTNKYIYEDDTPGAGGGAAASPDLIAELVTSHLRPRIPRDLIASFEEKRLRLAPGYPPETPRELIDWVKERLVIPADEWERLLPAMTREAGIGGEEIEAAVALRVVKVAAGKGSALVTAIETLPELLAALGRTSDDVAVTSLTEEAGAEVAELAAAVFARPEFETDDDDTDGFARLIGFYLAFHGPVTPERLAELFAVPPSAVAEALRSLEETGQVVVDLVSENAAAPEACDAGNLEALLRGLRRSRAPVFEALPLNFLPLHLAAWQGLAARGRSLNDLQERLGQLFGFPLPAGAWEEEVLTARLDGYATAWLDSLMGTSDLLWFGCGEKRLSFAFPEDLPLFRDASEADGGETPGILPDRHGRYSVSVVAAHAGLPPEGALAELWRQAWNGRVASDSYVPVRRGILGKFSTTDDAGHRGFRHRRGRWQVGDRSTGTWFPLPRVGAPDDLLAREELNRERVRLLLDRYGIVFRELLARELSALSWQRLFRTLRIMELSGEVLSGSFFLGIPGLQFISHEAFRHLRQGLPADAVYMMNALDPASLSGTGLEGLKEELPPRVAGTHLVYHGPRLVLISRRYGKDLRIAVPPDDPDLPAYLEPLCRLLGREFNPRPSIAVETINAEPARQSPYREVLVNFGFIESYGGLELWRRY